MSQSTYQECCQCVMDTSDPDIIFNGKGVCNHCVQFENETKKSWFPNEIGARRLEEIVEKIKLDGRGKEYNCIIGLSGGVDSSYLALKIKEYGLRPLVVHVDAGWNSELAVYNIERVIKYCGFTLHTHVMNWEEVRELQLAYLKSGVANQDTVQDHAFFASLYHFAVKNKISYIISGGNIATESVFPKAWHHSAMDAVNIHAINKKYGSSKLRDYKTISLFQYYFYYPFVKRMKTFRPLNYLPYCKEEALEELKEKVGYKEYGRKHGESRFTKFFQNHYLPKKFNYDKRRPHLSSQILSGELTKIQAVELLSEELYSIDELDDDMAYLAKKLHLSIPELEALITSRGRSYSEFKNWDNRYNILKYIQKFFEKLLNRNIKNYS